MTTTTHPSPTEARATLEEAQAHRQALLDQAGTGAAVDPAELASAVASVTLAEHTLAAATQAAAASTEDARLQAIETGIAELTKPDADGAAAIAGQLVAAIDTAGRVLAEVVALVEAYNASVLGSIAEIRAHGPLPAAMTVRDRYDSKSSQITVNGRTFKAVEVPRALANAISAASTHHPDATKALLRTDLSSHQHRNPPGGWLSDNLTRLHGLQPTAGRPSGTRAGRSSRASQAASPAA